MISYLTGGAVGLRFGIPEADKGGRFTIGCWTGSSTKVTEPLPTLGLSCKTLGDAWGRKAEMAVSHISTNSFITL